MVDTRDLPDGNWTTTREPPFERGDGQVFKLKAISAAPKDSVVADVHFGFQEGLCGVDFDDWQLPPGVSRDDVWCLARIEPRNEQAKGGTTYLVSELTRFADVEQKWIVTQVETDNSDRDAAVTRVLTRCGFVEVSSDFPGGMRRAPAQGRSEPRVTEPGTQSKVLTAHPDHEFEMTEDEPEPETTADAERSIRLRVEIPKHLLAELSQVAAERAISLEDLLRERLKPEIERHLAQRVQQTPELPLDEPRAFSSSPIFEFSCGTDTIPPKRFIGCSDVRVCLFCGRSEAQVSFTADAHIIPAAFGNRSLFSLEECNDCNHRAGRQLEDHLVRALAPERGLLGLRNRKGHVKHKPRGKSGKSYVMSGGRETKIVYHDDDDSIRVDRTSPEEFDVHIRGGTYRPMAVAKSLARMALLVLNENARRQVGWLLSWLNGTQTWRPAYAEAFWP